MDDHPDGKALAMLPVWIPADIVDGAVMELMVVDGVVAAEIRIPGPAVP